MKSKRLILFFLLLSALLPPIYAADYGEDEPYLGQVVDDYINADNVTVAYKVINNLTLDCMELNYTWIEGTVFQNFSNYVEVDELNDMTVTDYTITVIDQPKNRDGHVYKDFGVNYFSGDYEFQIGLKLIAGDPLVSVYDWFACVSNEIGDYQEVSNFQGLYLRRAGSAPLYRLGITSKVGGVGAFDYYAISLNTMYYVNFSRIGTDLYGHIHSDEARTNLLHTLHLSSVETNAWRYIYGVMARDAPSGSAEISTYCEKLDIGGVVIEGYESGYYYTAEILVNDTGLVFMYNATIEENTGIEAEFSSDNSTWVDHNNEAGSDTLIIGFESLDLRDLNTTSLYMRFNMTTDGIDTPRIYQVRYVTITNVTIGDDGETVYVDTLFPGLAIGISLLIIAVIYVTEKRR